MLLSFNDIGEPLTVETMLGTMGSAKKVDVPTQTRDSLSMNTNNSWIQKTKSSSPKFEQRKAYNVCQATNVSTHNLLQVCKPLYIRLERLPDFVVGKPGPIHGVRLPKRKRSRQYWWKYGIDVKVMKLRQGKKRRVQIKTLETSQSPVNDEVDNADKTVALDPNSNLSGCKSSKNLLKKINGPNQSTDCNNVHGSIAHKEKLSKTDENELRLTTKVNGEDSHNQDQISRLAFLHEHEPHITKSNDVSQNMAFDTSTGYSKQESVVLSETNSHLNDKTSLSMYKEHEDVRPVRCRQKRIISPIKNGAFTEQQRSDCLKKQKFSATVAPKKQKNSSKLLPDRKSLKRRNSKSTAKIVVNRLDTSHSPLIQKWKDKVRSPSVDRGIAKSPMENHVVSSTNTELEEPMQLESSVAECPAATLTNQEISTQPMAYLLKNKADVGDENINLNEMTQGKTIPNVTMSRLSEKQSEMPMETIMCDSNEDEDDEEIIEFFSARRRVRSSIDSRCSKNKSNIQTNIQIQPSDTSAKDPLSNKSDTDVPRKRQRAKTPRVTTEIRTRSMDNPKPEKSSKHTESWITPPITRSKSRAAMESWNNESTLHSNEVSTPIRELELYDQNPNVDDETLRERPENQIIQGNENQTTNSSMENDESIVQHEQNRSNKSPLEEPSEVHCNIAMADKVQTENSNRDKHPAGSRKATVLKSPFVVLIRLEDIIDISEGNVYSSNNIKFNNITFSTKFSGGRIRHGSDSYENIDLHYEDIKAPGRATDLLDIDHRTGTKERMSKSPCRQNGSAMTENNGISEQCQVKSIESSTNSLIGKVTLPPEGQGSQEKIQSDVEPLSISEDHDKTITKLSTCKLSEGILTDANCCNDRSIRNPSTCSPENLDEHCKHCNCKEHRRDNQHLKCQNISATYKCVTCKSLFKNANVLEQHRTSNAFCRSGFRCTICKMSYMTLIELAKHRVTCAERGMHTRNIVEQITNEESTTESLTTKSSIMESRQSKNKQKKLPARKSVSKPGRPKIPCRVDDLICSVCSVPFATRSALSEHIFRHSTEELQEAYRMAKTKVGAEIPAGNKRKEKESNKSPENTDCETADAHVLTQNNRDTGLAQVSIQNSAPTITSNDSLAPSVIICPCHSDKGQMPTDRSDLQIEMVLHCKYCRVLFRRRECLEVHYRTSTYCANDRTNGRLARLFCANCELTLKTWMDMRHHLETHAKQNADGTVRFVCNICRIVFVGFGTLFYNHWFSHLRDTMFVAGRYNFPRMSIQPIDGTEKLPAGAKPDENYLYVAEHVCSKCKKPFSTRRDLESHTKTCRASKIQNISKMCTSSVTNNTNKQCASHKQKGNRQSSISCDVCNLNFPDRTALNNHAVTSHDKRFSQVVSSALEKETGTQSTEAIAKEPVVVTSSVNDDQELLNASAVHINGSAPANKSLTTNDSTVTTVGNNDVNPGDALLLNVPVEYSTNENTSLDTEEISISISSVTSTNTNLVTETIDESMLCDTLSKVPSSTNLATENHMATTLEDTSVPASANVNLPSIQAEDGTHDSQLSCEDNARAKNDTHNGSASNTTSTDADNIVHVPRESLIGIAVDRCLLNQANESNLEGGGNTHLSKVCESTNRNISPGSLLKNRLTIPEIIDIVDDEVEECGGEKTASNGNRAMEIQQSYSDSLANNKKSLASRRENRISGLSQLANVVVPRRIQALEEQSGKKSSSTQSNSSRSSTGSNLTNSGSGMSSRSEFYSWATKASQLSFEEARWIALTASTNSNDNESTGAKKQGFLRVKNLSELRAVKTHVCSTCDARFESDKSLIQHQQVHMGGVVGKDVQYPKGISAALVLPDPSERSETPASTLPAINTISTVSIEQRQLMQAQTPSCVPPFIEVITSRSATTGTYPSTILMNNDSIGAWIQSGGQHMPTVDMASPSVNATNLLQNNCVSADVNIQGQSANSLNSSISNPILLTSTTITQSQDNLSVQRHPLITSGGSLTMQETNPHLLESRAGSMGFHVLPPMVVLPPQQVSKRQHRVLHHTSSNNYLPTNSGNNNNPVVTYQNDPLNNWICTLCPNFRCETMEELKNHLTKHYTDYQNPAVGKNSIEQPILATQSSMQPILTTIASGPTVPTSTSFMMRQETIRHGLSDNITNELNPLILNNWTVKETPQGPMWVTPVPHTNAEPSMSPYVLSNNRSILQSAPPKSIYHNSTPLNTGQIVFRCMICKSALYKNYPPLLNHVMFVHGIRDFASRGLENIVQKSYHCTQCPNTTALFDCEEQFRNHVTTNHPHTCSTCHRTFVSVLSLKAHQEHCRVPSSSNGIAFGSN